MIPVLTADEMRRADRFTIDDVGLPGVVLMENAGAAVESVIRERFPAAGRIVVLCGRGNNGGDGFVVARRLRARGARAFLLGRRADVKGDARAHLEAAERSGTSVVEVPDAAAWEQARGELSSADVVVDALLGTGLEARPEGLVGEAVAELARRAGDGRPVVAVDIPSGVPSDGGGFDWPVVRATVTVTFAAPKRGHVLPPACDVVGELVVADIGIPPMALARVGSCLALVEDEDAAAAFPERRPGAHKGDFGHVLVVAGSRGKTGAAVLAATGALRAGAGLVTVATAASCVPVVAGSRAELMTEPLSETTSGAPAEEALDRLLALAGERDAAVVGPGLGRDASTWRLVRAFVARCPVPLLVDADGLNAIAPDSGEGGPGAVAGRRAPTVLTPHPGEMGRLTGRAIPEIQAGRVEAGAALAAQVGAVVVLKGQRSVVAEPGGRVAVTAAGNPGLATGGTGDVLAGVIGALLARLDAWPASTAGVHLHGRAGDLAARAAGADGMVAGDVADALPGAIRMLRGSRGGGASAR